MDFTNRQNEVACLHLSTPGLSVPVLGLSSPWKTHSDILQAIWAPRPSLLVFLFVTSSNISMPYVSTYYKANMVKMATVASRWLVVYGCHSHSMSLGACHFHSKLRGGNKSFTHSERREEETGQNAETCRRPERHRLGTVPSATPSLECFLFYSVRPGDPKHQDGNMDICFSPDISPMGQVSKNIYLSGAEAANISLSLGNPPELKPFLLNTAFKNMLTDSRSSNGLKHTY